MGPEFTASHSAMPKMQEVTMSETGSESGSESKIDSRSDSESAAVSRAAREGHRAAVYRPAHRESRDGQLSLRGLRRVAFYERRQIRFRLRMAQLHAAGRLEIRYRARGH